MLTYLCMFDGSKRYIKIKTRRVPVKSINFYRKSMTDSNWDSTYFEISL